MASENKCIIVPREEAVFWMDKNGVWHNEHGKFEHPKIIRHFNLSIRKDDLGYYLSQATDEVEEKVYFPHEDTALFVVDISLEKKHIMTLNTTEIMPLEPGQLFTQNDSLYVQTPEHCIKFSQHALIKLSRHMEEIEGRLCLRLNQTTHTIPEK
ncbi:MAG: MFS transporter permease [Desulfobacteraceae bacterium]|nr:MFS transporter permease [Desulfobacteraceae bacterium]